jgi:hypothetical protein
MASKKTAFAYANARSVRKATGFVDRYYRNSELNRRPSRTERTTPRGKPLPIIYDGKPLKQAYRADFRVIR